MISCLSCMRDRQGKPTEVQLSSSEDRHVAGSSTEVDRETNARYPYQRSSRSPSLLSAFPTWYSGLVKKAELGPCKRSTPLPHSLLTVRYIGPDWVYLHGLVNRHRVHVTPASPLSPDITPPSSRRPEYFRIPPGVISKESDK